MEQTEQNIKCVVMGGGGHARVLIETLLSDRTVQINGILDPDKSKWNTNILEIPILGNDSIIPDLISQGVNYFAVGIGSVGNNQLRRELFELALSYGLKPLTGIHSSSICSESANIGPGSQIFPGAIINYGSQIESNVIINTGAIVEHDCIIESHSHIATGARLCGTVKIGEESHIGAGAIILQNVQIGTCSIIGAGAVVLHDVENNSIVAGIPARPINDRCIKD